MTDKPQTPDSTIPLFLLALCIVFSSLVPEVGFAKMKSVRMEKPCKMPAGSYRKSGKVHEFTLENGMIGGCKSSDNKKRIRADGSVDPYKERAEIASATLKAGRKNHYTQTFRFDPAAESVSRTTFFQIHQHGPAKSCKPNPVQR